MYKLAICFRTDGLSSFFSQSEWFSFTVYILTVVYYRIHLEHV